MEEINFQRDGISTSGISLRVNLPSLLAYDQFHLASSVRLEPSTQGCDSSRGIDPRAVAAVDIENKLAHRPRAI